jgi:hypothetical protein
MVELMAAVIIPLSGDSAQGVIALGTSFSEGLKKAFAYCSK